LLATSGSSTAEAHGQDDIATTLGSRLPLR
jgi:hypothetical protein